jgi:hypothetical protein
VWHALNKRTICVHELSGPPLSRTIAAGTRFVALQGQPCVFVDHAECKSKLRSAVTTKGVSATFFEKAANIYLASFIRLEIGGGFRAHARRAAHPQTPAYSGGIETFSVCWPGNSPAYTAARRAQAVLVLPVRWQAMAPAQLRLVVSRSQSPPKNVRIASGRDMRRTHSPRLHGLQRATTRIRVDWICWRVSP